jgi:exodeoxyribonuclease V alpha subunit
MIISGSVENVIYQNPESGYTVFELDVGGELVVCVGNFSALAEGQSVEVEGEFRIGKYGQQFYCTSVRYHTPKSPEAITRYLASGLIKGVGPATAAAIVEKFGADTLEIIEKSPSRLTEVRGISVKKAGEISSSVIKLKEMQAVVMFLQKYNITINTALKIYRAYQERTESVLRENPYKLIEDVEGIGFVTADKIAASMGIEPESEFRIRAALIYALRDAAESSGSTYLPIEELTESLSQLIGIDFYDGQKYEKLEVIIDGLVIDGQLKVVEKAGGRCIMLSKHYSLERSIASRLVRLINYLPPQQIGCDLFIDEFERQFGIKLDADQRQAVKLAVENGVSVITGGPGTGKTTIIKCILYLLRQIGCKALLCAPTGRAAKRLSESTGEEAKTIHRMLELTMDGEKRFLYNEAEKLKADAVIVDEVSMVDEYLFGSLIRALADGTRLILVGDKDQLPSVGAGNVLADIISCGAIKVKMLTHIYRQGKESLIVYNAHAINRGEKPILTQKDSDFFFIEKKEPQQILETVSDLVTRRLPNFLGVEPSSIQVLTPMRKGVCGVENLNKTLQELINPPDKFKKEYSLEGKLFREGDKVMQTANNYELQWRKGLLESGEGVFNGDIGRIAEINGIHEIMVEFEDGRVAEYSAADINDLSLAYAISVHKSQGCEFDTVIIPIVGGPPTLLTRNLLYTAITRAKKMAVLVGYRYMIARMVKNNYTASRYSMLADFIKEHCDRIRGLMTGDGLS